MGKIINQFEEILLSGLLAFMTVLTFIQVVLRYIFNTGWVWSLEATTYSFGALVLIGMAYGVRTRSHIAVDMFTRRLSPKLIRAVILFVVVICLVYCALMFYGATTLVNRLYILGNNARDIPAPKWLLTIFMPLGFLLLSGRFVEAGLKAYRGDLGALVPTEKERLHTDTKMHEDNAGDAAK